MGLEPEITRARPDIPDDEMGAPAACARLGSALEKRVSMAPVLPDREGLWLLLDGSTYGVPIVVHDPSGDGLQFDYGGNASNTDLSAYQWAAGPLVVDSTKAAPIYELDSAAFLDATPAGSCRRVTETSGDSSLVFEDDRKAADDAGASALAKLEAGVGKMVDGCFGAGTFVIGAHEVYVVDPRFTSPTPQGLTVSTSQTPRSEGG